MNSHFDYVKTITLNPSQRKDDDLLIDGDADFLVERVYAIYDYPFKIGIKDTTSNYDWFSDRIRSDAWFGTPQYPNLLSKPIELKRNSIIKFDIENLNNSNPNNIQIVFEGYKIYDNINFSKQKYFCYVQDIEIQPLDLLSISLKINADSDFLIKKLYAYKDNDYSIDLKWSSTTISGRRFNNEFINIDNLFGSVLRPNELIHPIKLIKNSILQIEVKNNLNSVENIQLVFDGIKLWE